MTVQTQNRLSNCHTFTVMQFIMLSFKHQTNKPTAISVEHNQRKEKHKTSELLKIVNALWYFFTFKIIPYLYSALPVPSNHMHFHYVYNLYLATSLPLP